MDKMHVSVIVPFYNAARFLDETIQSVLDQTYDRFQLILVDDGSTDESVKICQKYQAQDNRICLVQQPNRGPAGARNTGVRHAKGDFVFFLDADDFLPPQALTTLVSAYEKDRPSMVMSNFAKLNPDGKIINQPVTLNPHGAPWRGHSILLDRTALVDFVRHFFHYPSNHIISYCWGKLYKRSTILEYLVYAREEMRLFEDYVFNLHYLKHTRSALLVNEPLYFYRMHSQHISLSMSLLNALRLIQDMNIFRKESESFFHSLVSDGEILAQVHREIGHALTHYAIIFLVRSGRLLSVKNLRILYRRLATLMKAPIMQWAITCYKPKKGNSRLLPFFMRHQWIIPTLFLSFLKGCARYGRPLLKTGPAGVL